MNFVYAVLLAVAGSLFLFAAFTRIGAWWIGHSFPPVGQFATVAGTRLHFVHDKGDGGADLPAIIFLHGASGNLKDQMTAFRGRLAGRAGDLVFVDRPGHGWSDRGSDSNKRPDGQAATLAALLDRLGIGKAILVGHSFGGAIAASFALNHPDRTIGTVFLSPVSHPWPGGVDWYYDLTARPVVGRLFSETLALPAGLIRLKGGIQCVFAPNSPAENYLQQSAVALVLRPWHFRANAIDVASLFDYVKATSPRYKEIKTPAVVITGNKDTIVLPRVHSLGLAEDLENSELVWVENLGHKPDYVATDLAVAAIEKIAGFPRDLQAQARMLETRIAGDRFGPVHRCLD